MSRAKSSVCSSCSIRNPAIYSRGRREILNIFASQSAAAIESARLYEAVREERDRVVAVEEEFAVVWHGPSRCLAQMLARR